MSELVFLDDPGALDAARVGAKAAALAEARRRGAVVLPGFVVPVGRFAPAIDRAAALVGERGVHAAQLQLSLEPLDALLASALASAAGALGDRLVCRSSSPVEVDSSWSGAFTSFLDVTADELPIAVMGCVASVFSAEVAGRVSEELSFSDIAPAPLIQPFLEPRCAGAANLTADGAIEVTAVAGSPAPLLSGWVEGRRATLRKGSAGDGPGVDLIGGATLERIASLLDLLGGEPGTTIEWAATSLAGDEQVVLLQVGRSTPRAPRAARRATARSPLAPDTVPIAAAVASVVARYAGPLGEALMLPWSLAPSAVAPIGTPSPARPLLGAFERAVELAAALNERALAGSGADAVEFLSELSTRGSDVELRRVLALHSIDTDAMAELHACCESIEAALVGSGAILPTTSLWRLQPEQVAALHTGTPSGRLEESPGTTKRWQRLFQLALESAGTRYEGESAGEGLHAGIAVPLAGEVSAASVPADSVLVLDAPLTRYAPLLWRAGGLVCRSGSESAHLFEVARSRRVPSVVVRELGGAAVELAGRLVLVDAEHGELRVLAEAAAEPSP